MAEQITESPRKGRSIALAALLVIILGGLGGYFAFSASASHSNTMLPQSVSNMSTSPMLPASSTASSTTFLAASLLAGTPPTLGSMNVSVTIVEFGDYQCPTCGGWYATQEPSLIQNLIDTGKAKLVWRDFDYYGPDSISASGAAYAAGEQGKFWQFHDLLFQNQQTPNNGWVSRQNMDKFAQELGLNLTEFDASFNGGKYIGLINSNHALGVQAGVTETPTFYLIGPDGKVVTIAGGQPESVFEQAVTQLTSG